MEDEDDDDNVYAMTLILYEFNEQNIWKFKHYQSLILNIIHNIINFIIFTFYYYNHNMTIKRFYFIVTFFPVGKTISFGIASRSSHCDWSIDAA